jgi:hypothetical protein
MHAWQERSRYSIDVMDVDTLMQRITDKEREKMAQCQQVKKKKEYEQLKECTFTPHINRAVPKQVTHTHTRTLAHLLVERYTCVRLYIYYTTIIYHTTKHTASLY